MCTRASCAAISSASGWSRTGSQASYAAASNSCARSYLPPVIARLPSTNPRRAVAAWRSISSTRASTSSTAPPRSMYSAASSVRWSRSGPSAVSRLAESMASAAASHAPRRASWIPKMIRSAASCGSAPRAAATRWRNADASSGTSVAARSWSSARCAGPSEWYAAACTSGCGKAISRSAGAPCSSSRCAVIARSRGTSVSRSSARRPAIARRHEVQAPMPHTRADARRH